MDVGRPGGAPAPGSDFRPDAVAGEEVLALPAYLPPIAHPLVGAREAAEPQRAVPLRDHARVEQPHDAEVLRTADEPPEALLELEGGVREEVAHEAVLSLLRQALEAG